MPSALAEEATRASSRRHHRARAAGVLVMLGGVLALFLAPLYLRNDYQVRILVLICIFGAASVGWNLLGGYANQVSLGHAVFFGVGAYTVAIFQGNLDLSPWLAIPVGAGISVAVALVIGWPTFQLSGHYFSLGTIALLQIVDIIARYWEGLTGGPTGIILPILPSNLWNLQFDGPVPYLYISGILLIAALAVGRIVRNSRLGLQLDAIRLNPHAASLAGVNLFRAKMKALVVSAIVVSVAGSVYASFLQFVDPDTAFSFNTSINMALFAIVGGVSLWWGPALGALILIPVAEYVSLHLTGNLAAIGQLSYGLVLILLIIIQPRGIGGWLSRLWQRTVGGGW